VLEARVDTETERTAKLFLHRVRERYNLREAYLFGSRANQTMSSESDADIALLFEGKLDSRADTAIEMAAIAFDVMLETGILVDALPFWEEEWMHPERFGNPALIRNILRDGVRL
jgi:predicted nucleotidyltransferase